MTERASPAPSSGPEGGRREIVIEATAETLEGHRKEGKSGGFTLYSDESARLGGGGTAPAPLNYLCIALAFWLLTQLVRAGHTRKVAIQKARISVKGRFATEGSVLAETVQSRCVGFETRLEIESSEATAQVASLVRSAENSCYVLQSLLDPVPVERSVALNGTPLDLQSLPPT